MPISIKSPQEIELMRQGGKRLARIFKILEKKVKPGLALQTLDRIAEETAYKLKAKPAFKNYHNFPASLCTSVNEVVVHGLPTDYKLQERDILGLDFGLLYQGYYTDMAITLAVGKVPQETRTLIYTAKKALFLAIKEARPGNYIGDISFKIQSFVERRGYAVVRSLVGHGIGKQLHEEPRVPNFGSPHQGPLIKKGMTFTIEPMITTGGYNVKTKKNGFSVVTVDKGLAAHFEHTLAITERGCEILTL